VVFTINSHYQVLSSSKLYKLYYGQFNNKLHARVPSSEEHKRNKKKYAQNAWFVSGETPMLTHISGIPITQHDANNAVHQIKVTAFNGLPYADLI
jgi:hypothetical protein